MVKTSGKKISAESRTGPSACGCSQRGPECQPRPRGLQDEPADIEPWSNRSNGSNDRTSGHNKRPYRKLEPVVKPPVVVKAYLCVSDSNSEIGLQCESENVDSDIPVVKPVVKPVDKPVVKPVVKSLATPVVKPIRSPAPTSSMSTSPLNIKQSTTTGPRARRAHPRWAPGPPGPRPSTAPSAPGGAGRAWGDSWKEGGGAGGRRVRP
jgi:hypothetical protein